MSRKDNVFYASRATRQVPQRFCRHRIVLRLGRRSLHGAILIGGLSRRMGTPKAALVFQERRLIDHAVDLVRPLVNTLAVVGRIPECLRLDVRRDRSLVTIPDDPSTDGPLAGIAGALAWNRTADWLCLSCDMPGLTSEAIAWLLTQHTDFNAATVGLLPGRGSLEPFPAVYGPSALMPVRSFIRAGGASLRGALAAMNARAIPVPPRLIRCWQNINTPLEWGRFLNNRLRPSDQHTQEKSGYGQEKNCRDQIEETARTVQGICRKVPGARGNT